MLSLQVQLPPADCVASWQQALLNGGVLRCARAAAMSSRVLLVLLLIMLLM